MKIEEEFENIYAKWKKNGKKEVLKEVQKEISDKFDKLKKKNMNI
jgi:hypothetical protein